MEINTIICGECLEVMKGMEDNSVDSIVTDPPYGLSFMGKKWDYDVPSVEIWKECLRVLKPGGFLLSFAGTRTYHRMVVNIEDAGFQVRDMIAWIYGSGFPKSHNIGKGIDKKLGKKREVVGKRTDGRYAYHFQDGNNQFVNAENNTRKEVDSKIGLLTSPATPQAKQWEGWGTALKPACEPICVARKPLEGTVAENVLKYGVGGLNIDACRVRYTKLKVNDISLGRWPANLIHDGSEEVVGMFPETNGEIYNKPASSIFGNQDFGGCREFSIHDSGSASRFFYSAKANKTDRDAGCEGLENVDNHKWNGSKGHRGIGDKYPDGTDRPVNPSYNNHPTVKPTALMRYLVRLVTPPNGIILDPFFGSGSTGKAAKLEHFNYIGIEMDKDYCEIARLRIAAAKDEPVKKKKMKLKKLV